MVQPENGIEGGVRDIGHVTAISNQGVDDVVHVLYTVIRISVFVSKAGVGEGCIALLRCQQLISKIMKPEAVSAVPFDSQREGLTIADWPLVDDSPIRSG